MDNNQNDPRVYDHQETFEEVIKPMMEKVRKVCEAFKMPSIMLFQTATVKHSETEMGDTIIGHAYIPGEQSGLLMQVLGVLANSHSPENMRERIIKLAAMVVADEIRDNGIMPVRGEAVESMREFFAELEEETQDKVDKPLN